MTLFERLHSIANRATPERICKYKHALLLHKIYNENQLRSQLSGTKLQQQEPNSSKEMGFLNPNFPFFSESGGAV